MHRTRPTPSMSQIHSVAPRARSASWLRSGTSGSRSDSTSRAAWTGSSSSVCNSPSTRTDGRDSDERYRVDAPRAADTRSNRSRPETVGSEGGGSPDRIGCWKIGSTTAGGDVTTATGCEGGATSGGDGSTATG